MSLSLLKRTFSLILQDTQVQSRNAILSDATIRAELTSQLNALSSETPRRLLASEALTSGSESPKGRFVVDVNRRVARLEDKGFDFALSRFRDGVIQTPTIIRRRVPGATPAVTPADRIRYVLADPGSSTGAGGGVFCLDENMEVVRVFPNYRAASNGYVEPTGVAVDTLGAVETIAIACEGDHRVRLYNFTTGAHIVTIGSGIAGLPSLTIPLLTSPRSVSFDGANSRLFIACSAGAAGDATSTDVGFIAEFNLTVPATPVFVGYVATSGGDRQLAYGKCFAPSDVLFVDDTLYVANGMGDVGSFTRDTLSSPWLPSLSLEAVGANYVLGLGSVAPASPAQFSLNALDVVSDATTTRLLVGVSHLGSVESFLLTSAGSSVGEHEGSFGRSVHEVATPFGVDLPPQSPVHRPDLTRHGLNRPAGVVGDVLMLAGDTATSLLVLVSDSGVVGDPTSGRVMRMNVSTFLDVNTVTWASWLTGGGDLILNGWWLLDGDLPISSCVLEYRDPGDSTVNPAIQPGPWKQVSRDCASQIVSSRFQFRLRATMPLPVRAYETKGVGLSLTMV